MFNQHVYHNSNVRGSAFLEIVQDRPSPDSRSEDLPKPQFMPLKRTHLSGTVTGPLARLTIEHLFTHPDKNDGPVLEAVYRFPLPGDAGVTGARVAFGDVVIRAELAERGEAERDYDAARHTGRQAVLLTRESPDVFSLHVSGIEPGQDVRVTTEYVQLARSESAGFSLRVPLTPAPRYTNLRAIGGRHAHGQPLALAHDPGHRFSLDLEFHGIDSLRSTTHSLQVTDEPDSTKVALSDSEVVPDRDLLIEWELSARPDKTAMNVMTFRDGTAFEYFLAMVTPPRTGQIATRNPREIVLLVDRSGSMRGPKWQAADWAVQRFLSGLNEYDSFSVGLFHSQTRWLASQCLTASEDNVSAARRFVDEHTDSGGTELEAALREALECGRSPGQRSRHVVIITDAQVTNEATILELTRVESKALDRRRISVLCIDAAPNSHLVHELVATGGGRASFVTSDPDQEDIATALDDVLSWWDEPADTGLSLAVNRPDAWVMGRKVEDDVISGQDASRIDIGDLPSRRSTWVVARVPVSDKPLEISLRGESGDIIQTAAGSLAGDMAIKSLFGVRRLKSLEYQLESLSDRWSRHRRDESAAENLRELLVAQSLNYGLPCSETAFVAVREEAGKIVERGAIVPNAMPYGWGMQMDLQSQAHSAARVANQVDSAVAYSPLLSLQEDAYSPPRRRERRGFADRFFSQERKSDRTRRLTLFSGVPVITGDETVLLESESFGTSGRLIALRATISGDRGSSFDGSLELYVGDMSRPRARMRISDVLSQNGVRPLHVRVLRGQPVRLVLKDVNGSPPEMSIEIEVV